MLRLFGFTNHTHQILPHYSVILRRIGLENTRACKFDIPVGIKNYFRLFEALRRQKFVVEAFKSLKKKYFI